MYKDVRGIWVYGYMRAGGCGVGGKGVDKGIQDPGKTEIWKRDWEVARLE